MIKAWDRTDLAAMARIKKDHPLSQYSTEDLPSHLECLKSIPANWRVWTALTAECGLQELPRGHVLYAVHCAIVEANARGQP